MSWETFVDPALSGRICVTLLHSLWQVALLAGAARTVDWLWARRSVEKGYAIYVVAMLLGVAAAPLTCSFVTAAAWSVQGRNDVTAAPQLPARLATAEAATATTPPFADAVQPAPFDGNSTPALNGMQSPQAGRAIEEPAMSWSQTAPWIVALYAAGVLTMLSRLAISIWRAHQLAASAVVLRDGPLVDLIRSLAARWSMRVTPVLARAEQIVVPKVAGLIRPTVLIPAAAIAGLSTEQMELVLAHELAHIRRHDMWVNLLQRLSEAALFFNPSLWYLSRRISALRELCCDELTCRAMAESGAEPRARYAWALVRVVELSAEGPNGGTALLGPELASLAVGGRSPSELRRRIAHLFGEPLQEPVRLSRGSVLTVAGLAAFLVVGSATWRSQAEPASAEPATSAKQDVGDQAKGDAQATAANVAAEASSERYPFLITVVGRALDQEQKPIAGAEVYLASPRTGGKPLAVTKTDDQGHYRFDRIPLTIKRPDTNAGEDLGSFQVFGQAKGYGLAWRPLKWFYPRSEHVDGSVPDPTWDLPFKYGAEDPIELDLTFAPPAVLRGRVVNDLGQPLPGTRLEIRRGRPWNDDRQLRQLESLNWPSLVPETLKLRRTDDQGRFEFTDLPIDHRFDIYVTSPGNPPRVISAATRSGVDADWRGDRVYSGEMELVFARPRKVSLRVVYGDTGEPADRVGVSSGFFETTDDGGRVEVPLPDGPRRIEVMPRYRTPYLRTTAQIEVSAESAKETISIKLRPAAVVDITVVDVQTGEPLSGVDVWTLAGVVVLGTPPIGTHQYPQVYGYRSWEVETRISHYDSPRTDDQGKMRVLFEPGTHRIGVGLKTFPVGYEQVEPDGKEIDCQAGRPTSVEFKLRKTVPGQVRLRGVVIDEQKAAVAGAKVYLKWYPGGYVETEANQAGEFELSAPRDRIRRVILRATIAANQRQARAAQLIADAQIAQLPITLTLAPTRQVEIRVVDQKGQPLAGAKVALIGNHVVQDAQLTDNDGVARCCVHRAVPIEFAFAFQAGRGLDYVAHVVPRSQLDSQPPGPPETEDKRITLVLDGVKPLRVRVADPQGQPISGVQLFPWLMMKAGVDVELNLANAMDEISETTNADGEAVFDWIPHWNERLFSIWSNRDGYPQQRSEYDPGMGNGTLLMTLARKVPPVPISE